MKAEGAKLIRHFGRKGRKGSVAEEPPSGFAHRPKFGFQEKDGYFAAKAVEAMRRFGRHDDAVEHICGLTAFKLEGTGSPHRYLKRMMPMRRHIDRRAPYEQRHILPRNAQAGETRCFCHASIHCNAVRPGKPIKTAGSLPPLSLVLL